MAAETIDKDRGLAKEERICSLKVTEQIFKEGTGVFKHPLRAVYVVRKENTFAKSRMLISVPKKRFKHAVDRNSVKRQVREAYRLNKHLLNGALFDIAFIYASDKHYSQEVITRAVVACLNAVSLRDR